MAPGILTDFPKMLSANDRQSLSAESVWRKCGGPAAADKTFFYLNYEGLRQRLDGTQIGLVPSPGFIAQVTTNCPV